MENEEDGLYIIVNLPFIIVQKEQPIVVSKNSLKGNRIEQPAQPVMLQWN